MEQKRKGTVGFTAGNFDLIHPGYIHTFKEAKRHCDTFIIFLQIDPSATRYTKYKPVIPLDELYKLIEFFKPDIRILGDDYIGKSFTGDDLPPKIIYTTRSHGWSTTKLKNLITLQTIKQNPNILNNEED